MALKNNTWKLNQWYDQDVAGNVSYSSGVNELYAWGFNNYGQLGQSNTTKYSSPVQIPGTNWATVGSAREAVGATKSNGELWVWGRNHQGQLGLGNQSSVESPNQVPGTTWNGGGVGDDMGMFSRTDGTLWTHGVNTVGQLGLNNTTNYYSPKQIPGNTWSRAPSVFAGSSCGAFKTDGTLWMWGANGYGQLGQNNTTQYSSPRQVGSDTTWSTDGVNKLCGGLGTYTLAIKNDNTLWAWGDNEYGILGQGKTRSPGTGHRHSSPVQIPGTTWEKVFCANSGETAFAIKTDGTLWAWGINGWGRLGQNSVTSYSSPVQIPGTWDQVGVNNGGDPIATKLDGTMWSWGRANSDGGSFLNLPSNSHRSSPVQIPGDWGGAMLGGGDSAFYALKQF